MYGMPHIEYEHGTGLQMAYTLCPDHVVVELEKARLGHLRGMDAYESWLGRNPPLVSQDSHGRQAEAVLCRVSCLSFS